MLVHSSYWLLFTCILKDVLSLAIFGPPSIGKKGFHDVATASMSIRKDVLSEMAHTPKLS